MIRPAHIVLVAAALAAVYAPSSHGAETPDALLGTWHLDLKQSTFSPGPGPRGQQRTYARDGDIEKLTAKGVGPDGKPTLVRYTARYDGKDYAITGSAGGDLISLKRIDDFTTESTQKRDGKPVITTTRIVSRDGTTLTVLTRGTRADGVTLNHRMVFERR